MTCFWVGISGLFSHLLLGKYVVEGFLFSFFFYHYHITCSHTSDTAKVKEEWVCECDKFDGFVVVCFVEGTKRAGIGGMRERERETHFWYCRL